MKKTPQIPESAPEKDDQIRILKIAQCPSLSSKSKLVYHIGCNDLSSVQLRIFANTGKGYFSKAWLPMSNLQRVFEKSNQITSTSLHSVCPGYVNTAGFILAALLSEGLVAPSESKARSYERLDSTGFASEVKALMDSGTSLKVEDKPTAAAPKKAPLSAPIKAKSVDDKPVVTTAKEAPAKAIQKGRPKKA